VSARLEAHTLGVLLDTGAITTDRLTKKARPAHCPRCGLIVLAGLDELGRKVRVDYHPTTVPGEALALLAGRDTYGLDGAELYQRLAYHIEGKNADATEVRAEHRCGDPPLPINSLFAEKQRPNYPPNSPAPY
jgi:hypothetical protein